MSAKPDRWADGKYGAPDQRSRPDKHSPGNDAAGRPQDLQIPAACQSDLLPLDQGSLRCSHAALDDHCKLSQVSFCIVPEKYGLIHPSHPGRYFSSKIWTGCTQMRWATLTR